VTDSKNNPSAPPPPPDDFAKTTPNIKLPENDAGNADWDAPKQYPSQPASDDWGNTVANIKPIDLSGFDTGSSSPKVPDWGETRANMNVDDFGAGSPSSADDFSGDYGKTTPYFKLPEAERAKYQNLPPTPTQQAEQEKAEAAAQGGIPGWVWAAGGISLLMIFLLSVLGVVAFIVLGRDSFELTVRDAPPGAQVSVDDRGSWGIAQSDGSILIKNVKNGTRKITIKHQNFQCEPIEVTGRNDPITVNAGSRCRELEVKKGEDCTVIKMGEEDKAERCYYLALQELPDPFTVEQLLKALNILVINFASDSADIPPQRMAAIKKGAEYIKRLNQLEPSIVIEIGGHTDSDGKDDYNQNLSEKRAASVKNLLVEYGVPGQMLQTRGYGESQPIDTNDTPDGKFHNRRIQYSLVKK
jgi:outer membrane protein OmpA-like peptidoglycan-associated protein